MSPRRFPDPSSTSELAAVALCGSRLLILRLLADRGPLSPRQVWADLPPETRGATSNVRQHLGLLLDYGLVVADGDLKTRRYWVDSAGVRNVARRLQAAGMELQRIGSYLRAR